MIPNIRNCMVFRHEQFPCSHICTYEDCNFNYRWVCVECMKNDRHKHGQNTQSHLLGQNDFKKYFEQIDFKQLSEQEDKISQYLRALHKIRDQINELDCYLQLSLKESNSKILRDLQQLINHQFFLINNDQIYQIVKLKQNPNLTFDQFKVDQSINQIILLSHQFLKGNVKQQQMVEYQNQLNSQLQQNQKIKFIQMQPKQLGQQNQKLEQVLQDQQVLQVQQVQQQVQQIQKQEVKKQPLLDQVYKKQQHKLTYEVYKKFKEKNQIYAAQISQNEKYLAYEGYDQRINIYNLEQQITKKIDFDHSIRACCFSRDSNLLYIGLQNGYFHCIQFETNISHKYKEQLHQYGIQDIYQLENDQVLSGSNKNIIISDIKEQRNLYKLGAPEGLEFNGLAIKNFNIIASGLSDKSINFYNQKLILLFRILDVTQYSIHQFKFLGDNQIIILDFFSNLYLWEVDLNKYSKKIRKIQYKNIICNVGVSQTKNQIITICSQYFVIFDIDFQNPQTFQHIQEYDVYSNKVIQLQSINYIIILGLQSMTIMKRTEEK